MDRSSSVPGKARRRGRAVAVVHAVALGSAGLVCFLTAGWAHWSIGALVALGAFAVGSDLASVETGSSKLKVSGMSLGTVLVAVRLGAAPAALVGVLTIAIGWFRWREAPHYLRNNLVTFAWFPLASALFFHAATRAFGAGEHDVGYYLFVVPTFALAIGLNFAGVACYQCYLDESSPRQKVREALLPLLSAQLFSAVLTVAAVFFVVHTGTVGIVLLALMLAIFQYLVGELLTSQRRGEELSRRATTDELTGLANRQRFQDALQERVATAQSSDEPFALMVLDLDRFKEINDTLGHHYGDLVLRDLGPRLADSVGSGGIVAHLGGDEFAVLPAQRTADPDTLKAIAGMLIACVEEALVVEQLTLEISGSIGIARYPLDGEDTHTLLRRADIAMYAAKEKRTSAQLYESSFDRHSLRRLRALSDLRRGLASDELTLHYQPIVDIECGTVRAAEALVRWQHPELGLLPPADFVPIAEQAGLIGLLTAHVLDRAIAECARWRAAGQDLIVAVNLSVRDLVDRGLPRQIDQLLAHHRLPADRLQLEITESMIMSDPDRALATVKRLNELGTRVAVDDFGTGYSSLANVKHLPINQLKIDRSFVSALARDRSDLIIVRSIVNLGHDLALEVIAEGVEDERTLSRLGQLACDFAQGYHFSRPLPADAFARWVDRAGRAQAAGPPRSTPRRSRLAPAAALAQ